MVKSITIDGTANEARKLARNDKFATIAVVALMFMLPEMAMAEPWDDMADGILNALTSGFTRTIAILVCIGMGIAAWAGKLTWAMAGRFIAGIVLIFGAAGFADMFIGTVE